MTCGWKKILNDRDQRPHQHLYTHKGMRTQDIGAKQLSSFKKTTNQWGQYKKQGIKTGLWSYRKSPLSSPHQGKKSGGWSAPPTVSCVYCTSLWGKYSDLGLPQVVGCKLSNAMSRWQCHDSTGSDEERVVQGAWHIVFTHGSDPKESRP